MSENCIYFVFSATPNRIGRIIRRFTKETYNHVSISMDADMENIFSFARRHYTTPFWGGFVHESVSRFHIGNEKSDIRVCKLPIDQQQFNQAEAFINKMKENREHYLYNHLSILSSFIHKRIHVKDAYTCVEFCTRVLEELGFSVSQKAYYTIGDLEKLLAPYEVYAGTIPDPTSADTHFFSKQPILKQIVYTCRDVLRLFPRLIHK